MLIRFSLRSVFVVCVLFVIADILGVMSSPLVFQRILPQAKIAANPAAGSDGAVASSSEQALSNSQWPVEFQFKSPDIWNIVVNRHDVFRLPNGPNAKVVQLSYSADDGKVVDFGYRMDPGIEHQTYQRATDLLLRAKFPDWQTSHWIFPTSAIDYLQHHGLITATHPDSMEKLQEWCNRMRSPREQSMNKEKKQAGCCTIL